MRYSVGDNVVIIPNLEHGTLYRMDGDLANLGVDPNMEKFRNAEATITALREVRGHEWYLLDIDDGMWVWCDGMFLDAKQMEVSDVPLLSFLKEGD